MPHIQKQTLLSQFNIPFQEGDWSLSVRSDNPYPWFLASEVGNILGIGNMSGALSALDSDEKRVTTCMENGMPTKVMSISEPGLYHLVLKSRKPEAQRFRRWVTHDVLPVIRSTGGYGYGNDNTDMCQGKKEAELYTDLIKSVQEAQVRLKVLKEPTISIRDVVGILDLPFGRNKLYRILRHLGMFQSDNKPCMEFIRNGFFTMEAENKIARNKQKYNWTVHVKLTSKGLRFLEEMTKNLCGPKQLQKRR